MSPSGSTLMREPGSSRASASASGVRSRATVTSSSTSFCPSGPDEEGIGVADALRQQVDLARGTARPRPARRGWRPARSSGRRASRPASTCRAPIVTRRRWESACRGQDRGATGGRAPSSGQASRAPCGARRRGRTAATAAARRQRRRQARRQALPRRRNPLMRDPLRLLPASPRLHSCGRRRPSSSNARRPLGFSSCCQQVAHPSRSRAGSAERAMRGGANALRRPIAVHKWSAGRGARAVPPAIDPDASRRSRVGDSRDAAAGTARG